MKITKRIRILIAVFLSLFILQSIFLLITLVDNSTKIDTSEFEEFRNILLNMQLVFLFLFFIVSVIYFFFIPVFLRRSLKDSSHIIDEISRGNYKIDINEYDYKKRNDPEIVKIIMAMQKMINVILSFDQAKKEKIIEHYSRLNSIMRIVDSGIVILKLDGEISFVSDVASEHFPGLVRDVNLISNGFNPEIENNIKKYAMSVLKSRSQQSDQQFFFPSQKRHLNLKSSIVRNESGEAIGAVIAIQSIEKKKVEKTEHA